MAHEFKPGDLALIVCAFVQVQNIGKVCELVQLVQHDEIYVAPDGETYQHADSPCWVTAAPGLAMNLEGSTLFAGWGLSIPAHLMPLKGDEQPAQVRQAERVQ